MRLVCYLDRLRNLEGDKIPSSLFAGIAMRAVALSTCSTLNLSAKSKSASFGQRMTFWARERRLKTMNVISCEQCTSGSSPVLPADRGTAGGGHHELFNIHSIFPQLPVIQQSGKFRWALSPYRVPSLGLDVSHEQES